MMPRTSPGVSSMPPDMKALSRSIEILAHSTGGVGVLRHCAYEMILILLAMHEQRQVKYCRLWTFEHYPKPMPQED